MMRAAVARFLNEYRAAFDDDFNFSNKAHAALIDAHCYLAGFTLDNQGLTPEEAKKLLRLLDDYENEQGDAAEAQAAKDDAFKRLYLAFHHQFA